MVVYEGELKIRYRGERGGGMTFVHCITGKTFNLESINYKLTTVPPGNGLFRIIGR